MTDMKLDMKNRNSSRVSYTNNMAKASPNRQKTPFKQMSAQKSATSVTMANFNSNRSTPSANLLFDPEQHNFYGVQSSSRVCSDSCQDLQSEYSKRKAIETVL